MIQCYIGKFNFFIDFEQGEVCLWVQFDNVSGIGFVVGCIDFDFCCVGYDVIIGYDQVIGRDEEI